MATGAVWAAWVVLMLAAPRGRLAQDAQRLTEERLDRAQATILAAKVKTGRVPASLAAVRLLALREDPRFVPYDGFGYRFSYQPLSAEHYVLRSFGADGLANTLALRTDSVRTELTAPPENLLVQAERPVSGSAALFNPTFLSGLKARTTPLWARLERDEVRGTRTLVVRDLNRPDFVMTNDHTGIEEFLWLSDGQSLVFTASPSGAYPDGVYRWDLATGESESMLSFAPLDPTLDRPLVLATLSHVDAAAREVHVFVAETHGTRPISPEILFAPERHLRLRYLAKAGARLAGQGDATSGLPQLPLPLLVGQAATGPAADVWSNLPREGGLETVVERWQTFGAERSPGELPYALFHLAMIFAEATKSLGSSHAEDAASLRAYGAEMARALYRQSDAPVYLRLMGKSLYEQMLHGKEPGWTFAHLEPPAHPIKKLKKRHKIPKLRRKTK